MELKIKLKGNLYHSSKQFIKELLMSHDLKWRGDFSQKIFEWRNPESRMIADFEKHPLTGNTVNTYILITSEDSSFFKEMQDYLIGIGGEIYGGQTMNNETMFKEKMEKWVEENSPNIKVLKEYYHAPDSFIRYKLKEFERKKADYGKKLHETVTDGMPEVKL